MSNVELVKQIYDAFSCSYREYSKTKSNYIHSVDKVLIEHFANRTSTLLDFGAGDGVRGRSLKEQLGAQTLIQTDISSEMLKFCKEGGADGVWDVSEPNWNLNKPKFDLIISLWNVLGHIPTYDDRLDALKRLRTLISDSGHLSLDVNNRHNSRYGQWTSRYRRIIDFIWPDHKRGDTQFNWEINGKKYPASGHLFTFSELTNLFKDSGWQIETWYAVDYDTGLISNKVDRGQLLFILRPHNA